VEARRLEGDQTLLPQALRHAPHRRPPVGQPHLLVELVRQVAVGVEELRPDNEMSRIRNKQRKGGRREFLPETVEDEQVVGGRGPGRARHRRPILLLLAGLRAEQSHQALDAAVRRIPRPPCPAKANNIASHELQCFDFVRSGETVFRLCTLEITGFWPTS